MHQVLQVHHIVRFCFSLDEEVTCYQKER